MSTLKVETIKIHDIKLHPNADKLELAVINGWQTIVSKNKFKSGDLAVYFPIDSVLPTELSDFLDVTKYLSKGRIKAVNLRGEPSYGLTISCQSIIDYLETQLLSDPFIQKEVDEETFYLISTMEGYDITSLLKVEKYVEIPKYNNTDEEVPHTKFTSYTNIENFRNYTYIIKEGEDVIFTEKIHGSNQRTAFIDGEYMVGSHNMRIKEYNPPKSKYWVVVTENMRSLLKHVSEIHNNLPVIMYGEIYGAGIQDLTYGMTNKITFRCFDIKIGEKYLNFDETESICQSYGVPTVPVLYRGPFSQEKLLSFATSKTLAGGDNIMEGVVIKLKQERFDAKLHRVVLKYVFDQYYTRKGGTEYQ